MQNSATVKDDLGNCYYDWKGVKQDYQEAVKWYCKAVKNESDSAKQTLRRHNIL